MKKRYWIPILSLIFIVILWISLPMLIMNYVNKVLSDIEGYEGSVSHVDLNLLKGAYVIEDLVIEKLEGEDRYPFVAIDQINFSLEWGALFKGRIVGDVELVSPNIKMMAETDERRALFGSDVDWTEPLKEMMYIQINRFAIRNGIIHYMDLSSDPVVDLPLRNIELEITNISNVEELTEELPSRINMTATSIGDGNLNLQAEANFLKQIPDFDLVLELEGVNIPDLNDFIEARARLNAKQGEFALYTELEVQNGKIEGYVKPVILNLRLMKLEDGNQNIVSAAWGEVAGEVLNFFTNQDKDQLATRVPIKGEIIHPEADVFLTIWSVFHNAFIDALQQSVEGMIRFDDL